MNASRPHRLGPWRQTFQWLISLGLLAIPFVRINHSSLLRLDIPTQTLHLGGEILHIEELYLFLLLCIALLLVFLLVTLVLGRAWCGWACPQTTLSDLAEWMARRCGLRLTGGKWLGGRWRKGYLHLFLGALSLLVGANIIWYFVSPYRFFPELLAGTLTTPATISWLTIATMVYLDLVLLRRLFCKEFCPYGRFQTVLLDAGTLTLRLAPEEAKRCIDCGACVRSCPMGIDIRRGFQVECINCGRCLDACREVMAKRSETGLIRYTFGIDGRGPRALLNPRILLVTAAVLVMAGSFIFATVTRPVATLKLARSATVEPRRLEDGRIATFLTAVIGNRSGAPLVLSLQAQTPEGGRVELRGTQTGIQLNGGERRRLEFALLAPENTKRNEVICTLRDERGRQLAASSVYLEPFVPRQP